ncbi:MAG: GIY-YIG nuclease family protein, partial [Candidatus Gottesmanbacteria bacterium]
YVYTLLSQKNNDLYIGYSEDLKRRFAQHNNGMVKSTKGYRPWKLVYYEGYIAKKDATEREKQLKDHKAKQDLKKQIKNSLINI